MAIKIIIAAIEPKTGVLKIHLNVVEKLFAEIPSPCLLPRIRGGEKGGEGFYEGQAQFTVGEFLCLSGKAYLHRYQSCDQAFDPLRFCNCWVHLGVILAGEKRKRRSFINLQGIFLYGILNDCLTGNPCSDNIINNNIS
jgi:hypothetical protein